MDERGAAGAFRAEDSRDGAAGEASGDGVERGEAGGEAVAGRCVWTQCERGDTSGVWVHASSPFLRLSYCGRAMSDCQEYRRVGFVW